MTGRAARPVIAVVASAGGISAMQRLLRTLSSDLPAAIIVVQHLPPSSGGALPRILQRSGPFMAYFGREGDQLKTGEIVVAPPDRHLLVLNDQVRLSRGPRQNGHRPAADPLLFSLALTFGRRTAVVVLSGALDDGAAGAAAVADRGGAVFVQHPKEALYNGMPTAALAAVPDATVAKVDELAVLLEAFAQERSAEERTMPTDERSPGDEELERRLRLLLPDPVRELEDGPGEYTGMHCPACDGPIYEVRRPGQPERFECLVGHAWSAQSFVSTQQERIESALRMAAEQLGDRAKLCRSLADRAQVGGRTASARMFGETAKRTETALSTIMELLSRVHTGFEGDSSAS